MSKRERSSRQVASVATWTSTSMVLGSLLMMPAFVGAAPEPGDDVQGEAQPLRSPIKKPRRPKKKPGVNIGDRLVKKQTRCGEILKLKSQGMVRARCTKQSNGKPGKLFDGRAWRLTVGYEMRCGTITSGPYRGLGCEPMSRQAGSLPMAQVYGWDGSTSSTRPLPAGVTLEKAVDYQCGCLQGKYTGKHPGPQSRTFGRWYEVTRPYADHANGVDGYVVGGVVGPRGAPQDQVRRHHTASRCASIFRPDDRDVYWGQCIDPMGGRLQEAKYHRFQGDNRWANTKGMVFTCSHSGSEGRNGGWAKWNCIGKTKLNPHGPEDRTWDHWSTQLSSSRKTATIQDAADYQCGCFRDAHTGGHRAETHQPRKHSLSKD